MGSAHVDLSKRHSEKPSFSPEKLAEVKALMDSYPEGKHKSALIRILHIAEEGANMCLKCVVPGLVCW